jgi:aldehyde dehydrogenase (NAD+)
VRPTVFSNVSNDMPIVREIFGPALSIIAYRDMENAISVGSRIEAGRVPAAPFGGFKQSGIGREYVPCVFLVGMRASPLQKAPISS